MMEKLNRLFINSRNTFQIILGLFIIACTDNTTENAVENTDSLLNFEIIDSTTFTGKVDTMGYVFLIKSISEIEYNKIPSLKAKEDSIQHAICSEKTNGCMELLEKEYINKFDDVVERKGEVLKIKLKNGTTKEFKNNKRDDDRYEVYQFLGLVENSYVIALYYFESYAYVIVNASNGYTYKMVGMPRFSPNRNKVISGNYDMVAGFTFNGLQLYTFKNDSIIKHVMHDFGTWGPEEIKWKDDSTIYVKQKSQLGEELKVENAYAAIRIKEK